MSEELSVIDTAGQKMVLTITCVDTSLQCKFNGYFTLERLNELLEQVGYIADCEPYLPLMTKVGNTKMGYIEKYNGKECEVFYNGRKIKASSSELRILCTLLKRYDSNHLVKTMELARETNLSESSVKRVIGSLRNTLLNVTNSACTIRDNTDKAGYSVIIND